MAKWFAGETILSDKAIVVHITHQAVHHLAVLLVQVHHQGLVVHQDLPVQVHRQVHRQVLPVQVHRQVLPVQVHRQVLLVQHLVPPVHQAVPLVPPVHQAVPLVPPVHQAVPLVHQAVLLVQHAQRLVHVVVNFLIIQFSVMLHMKVWVIVNWHALMQEEYLEDLNYANLVLPIPVQNIA